MVSFWEPGTSYNYDDVVQYEGHRYKIIQPHRSQSDWTPPCTPALWGRLSDEDHNYGGDCKEQQPYHEQQPQHHEQHQQGQHDQQSQNQQKNDNPEEKKHWYEDEKTKKQLEIGGGVLAGAAVLAGGLFAYKKHQEHKEEDKADAWASNNWIEEAKARRENFQRNGSHEPATWILTHDQSIPEGAILVGKEHSWSLYICRAPHEGGMYLGKASEAFKNGGVLGYHNKEVSVKEYEVLVGDMSRLQWVPCSGKINVATLGYQPIEGGRDADGNVLYVVEAPHKDAVHPGCASEHKEGAFIPYDGKEVHIRDYRVLCYKRENRDY
jgi:hypothetical protein